MAGVRSGTTLISPEEIRIAAKAPFFSGLPLEAVAKLLGAATVRTCGRNTLLFCQGDKADRLFVVLEGRVKLFTSTESGDETVVELFGPIRTFAEAAMFASGRFPVNAEMVESGRLVQVGAEAFFRELSANPDLALMLLGTLARRHRDLVRHIGELKMKSPGQRLGSFLLGLADEQTPNVRVTLPFDKVLIASKLGMKPESLSRALARLRDIGVDSHKNEVVIQDIEALKEFCGESEGPVDVSG
ncbi:MAG: cyclic nucleotide-binding domain-containing protein [Rhodobacterales bacterium]|nr:cyclic nucleotide-binding domain-containing protein [Rhodobacterales bacterium]